MNPTFDTIYSPDDGGYYCEFWDLETGKAILAPSGHDLGTTIHPQRYQANKQAKKIMAAIAYNDRFARAIMAANRHIWANS